MKNLLLASLLAISLPAVAQKATIDVKDAWARSTTSQQSSTGAYMKLTASSPMKVVDVSSPAAGIVEIHEMFMDKDIMKMRAVNGLALPAGQAVELKPGGLHVMLMDLKAPVKAGDVIPIQLTLESADGKRQNLEVKAEARAMNMPAGHGAHGAHGAQGSHGGQSGHQHKH
jgi:periplasmic copper chaperone A